MSMPEGVGYDTHASASSFDQADVKDPGPLPQAVEAIHVHLAELEDEFAMLVGVLRPITQPIPESPAPEGPGGGVPRTPVSDLTARAEHAAYRVTDLRERMASLRAYLDVR